MFSKFIVSTLALALAASTSAQITTTEAELTFHVVSTNAATNNRNLQLRPNQYETESGFPPNTFYYVLVANLTSAILSSVVVGTTEHEGYLNIQEQFPDSNTTQFLFSFANATSYPPATDPNWQLTNLGDDSYALFHAEPLNTIYGFVLCEASFDLDEGGPWFDLTYVTYTGTPAALDPSCEFVGIRTTITPSV